MEFSNFAPEFYQSCALFADGRNFSTGLESRIFSPFLQNVFSMTFSRETVMEN